MYLRSARGTECAPGLRGSLVERRRSLLIVHAAEVLGVSRRTVYYRIREGKLSTIRTQGGSQRVLVSSIEALLQEEQARRLATRGVALGGSVSESRADARSPVSSSVVGAGAQAEALSDGPAARGHGSPSP